MENNLKAFRLRAGMTQKELSAITGIGQSKISDYENAEDISGYTIGSIYRMAEAMGVTVNDIISPLPELPKEEITPTIIMEQLATDKEAAEDGDIDAIINNRFM